jgi:hypothetical protein
MRPEIKTPNPVQLTVEGAWFVLTCACKWLRATTSEGLLNEYRREHEKRCKVARGEEAA